MARPLVQVAVPGASRAVRSSLKALVDRLSPVRLLHVFTGEAGYRPAPG